jgi:threonine/homoserine/homoserine lactone efflux protein
MIENFALLLLAAFPLMGSPGPATLSLAATASVYGVGRSLWYLAGIILGTSAVLLMIATGVTGILFAVPGVLPALTAAALGYILYLAYRIATAPVLSKQAEQETAPSMIGGLLLAIANPKAFAAIGAVYASVVIVPDQPTLDASVKIAVLFGVIVTVNSSWLMLGAFFSRVLRHPRTGRAINILFAVLLVLSVAMAALI